MSEAETLNPPAIGDNKPPEPIEAPKLSIGEQLKKTYAQLFQRADELLALARRMPSEIRDDETSGKVGDFVKAIRAWIAQADSTRKIENEEYRRIVAEINATFTKPADDLKKIRDTLMELVTKYNDEKAAVERAKLEEKAKREREESERQAKLAAEAETRRVAAEREAAEARQREEEARRKREEEERLAREAQERREKAERQAREAEARRRQYVLDERAACEFNMTTARTKLDQVEGWLDLAKESLLSVDTAQRISEISAVIGDLDGLARSLKTALTDPEILTSALKERAVKILDRWVAAGVTLEEMKAKRRAAIAEAEAEADRQREEKLRREREEREAKDAAEAAERARLRKIEEDRLAAAKAQAEAAEKEAAEAKARAQDARDAEREAKGDAKAATADARSAGRDERAAFGKAERADTRADKIERKVDGPDAGFVQARGDLGSVVTSTRRWVVRVESIADLDLEILRHLIHPDALQAAAQRYLESGGRELRGAIIEQITEGRVI